MEENRDQIPESETPAYTPRPAWQLWAARIGLFIVIIGVILYYIYIFNGGQL